jgi:hypothetical protein
MKRVSTALYQERSPVQSSRKGMLLDKMNQNMEANLAISLSQFQEYNDDQVERATLVNLVLSVRGASSDSELGKVEGRCVYCVY